LNEEPELFGEIAALAADYSATPLEEIGRETRLLGDLSLDGDDASAFMKAFADRFGVDFDGFVWLRYFGDEGLDLLAPALAFAARAISPAFARRWRAAREAEREITIGHLVRVAGARRWIHPAEASPPRGPHAFGEVLSALMLLIVLFLSALGALALYGYFTGRIGDISLPSLLGLLAAVAGTLFLIWASWRNVQRKLASA
jgi:hypothetical protein